MECINLNERLKKKKWIQSSKLKLLDLQISLKLKELKMKSQLRVQMCLKTKNFNQFIVMKNQSLRKSIKVLVKDLIEERNQMNKNP